MWVFALLLSGCREQILHDLSEREANKVISQLSEAKLEAKKIVQADGRWAIAVPSDSLVTALNYLDNQRIFTSRDSKTSSSSKGSMIPSREEQWFRYERSVALSIEESLAALPGVLEARVHVNLPEADPIFGGSGRGSGSGSVLLVVDDRFGAQDDEISALVGAAAGLSRDVVKVLKSKSVRETPKVAAQERPVVVVGASERSPESLPWQEGLLAVGVVVVALGAHVVRKRSKKRVVFSLPAQVIGEE